MSHDCVCCYCFVLRTTAVGLNNNNDNNNNNNYLNYLLQTTMIQKTSGITLNK